MFAGQSDGIPGACDNSECHWLPCTHYTHHRTHLHSNPFYSDIHRKRQSHKWTCCTRKLMEKAPHPSTHTDTLTHAQYSTFLQECSSCEWELCASAHWWCAARPTAATTQALMLACPTRAAAFWAIVCCSLSISSLSRCMRASSECRRTSSCFTAWPHADTRK